MDEREVVEEQLEELLEEGAVDPEDALEIALVAGLAERLGADPGLMAEAVAWREGPGAELLREAWSVLDHEGILADFDARTDGTTDEEEVEDALFDLDEIVAGAIWSGQGRVVRPIAAHLERSVRQMPELFAHLRPDAEELVQNERVGLDYVLYGYWFAITRIEGLEG